MRARSLAEWKDAMRMRARVTSNFTYADRAGNIFYVWNGSVPALPQPSGGDTVAVPARRTADVWTRYVPFDSLPQLLNPPGGYVHNENDSPYFTNLRRILDWTRYPAYFPEPSLRLRSQLAIALIDNKRKLSLEDVMALKHSYRMLLADRVKDDLVAAVRATSPAPKVAEAIAMLAAWDNTAAPASRGGVLFEIWWRRYTEGVNPDRCSRSRGRRAHRSPPRADCGTRRAPPRRSRGRWTKRPAATAASTSRGATCIACAAARWTCRWAGAPARSAASAC